VATDPEQSSGERHRLAVTAIGRSPRPCMNKAGWPEGHPAPTPHIGDQWTFRFPPPNGPETDQTTAPVESRTTSEMVSGDPFFDRPFPLSATVTSYS